MKQDASGRFLKNSVPWNKDKKGVYSKNVIAKMSEAKKGRRTSINTEFKKGQICRNWEIKEDTLQFTVLVTQIGEEWRIKDVQGEENLRGLWR